MPLHSLRPGNPHAKSTLSRLSTTENSISIPAEFRQSRSLFPISRLPPAEAYLTESLPDRSDRVRDIEVGIRRPWPPDGPPSNPRSGH